MRRFTAIILVTLLLMTVNTYSMTVYASEEAPVVESTPTATPTLEATPTVTLMPDVTAEPPVTQESTVTPIASEVPTPTPTVSPVPSNSLTPAPTDTPAPSATPTVTPDPSIIPEISPTPDPSITPEPSTTPEGELANIQAIEDGVSKEVVTYEGMVFDKSTGTITDYVGSATELTIPSQIDGVDVVAIGESAFAENYSIVNLSIQDGLTKLDHRSLYDIVSLRTIRLPSTLVMIGDEVFASCANLRSITLPESLQSLGNEVFRFCSSLQRVHITKNVMNIGATPFRGCNGLIEITTDAESPYYKAVENVLFTKDGRRLVQYIERKTGTSYIVPDEVVTIGERAFDFCNDLQTIILPDQLETIEAYAFNACSGLRNIQIPDSIREIGDFAFTRCSSLEEIAIPTTISTLNRGVFSSCSSLRRVIIPGNIQTIGETVFSGCNSLLWVTLQDGVERVGRFSFAGCESLQRFDIPRSVSWIGDYVFKNGTPRNEIWGETGTYAQTFAQNNRLKFVAVNPTVPNDNIALVFGMADYVGTENDLLGPINDTIGMGAVLEQAGYTVYHYLNYSAAAMMHTVQTIASNMDVGKKLLFAFSGHGADGGYLVGVNDYSVSIENLEFALSHHTGVKEVIIDACYSGDIIGKNYDGSPRSRNFQQYDSEDSFNNHVISVFSKNNTSSGSRNLAEAGYYVMTACSGSQLSYEKYFIFNPMSQYADQNYWYFDDNGIKVFRLGFFNIAFHEGFGLYNNPEFTSLNADLNNDHKLTWNELYNYAAEATSEQQAAQIYPENSNHTIYEHTFSEYDFNQDFFIDILDLALVAQYYGQDDSVYDMNSDGTINLFDLVLISRYIE